MTLPLRLRDRSGAAVKLNVSRHVACSWSWSLEYSPDHPDDESGFELTLYKSHPLWDLFEELVSHLPGWLGSFVRETDTYAQLSEKHSAMVARMAISEDVCKLLYFPLWEMIDSQTDNEDDE